MAEILAAAAERNLLEGDAAAPKVGGVCRDFALLAVSGFRAHGIPARLRVGFANYLTPGHWEDHWLCEWHDRGRWKRIDVEFAAAVEGLPFSAFDVPHDRFLTASEALLRIANEPNTASRFGVSSLGLGGEWFVAGSLFRDMAALRKLELKPWDYWGLSEKLSRVSSDWPQHARATLNHLASRLRSSETEQADGEPAALAEWPLPAQVLSFPQGEPVRVVLQNA